MDKLPILEFKPIFKETVWGGRRLAKELGKTLPSPGLVGESWEIADLSTDQSVVSGGAFAGRTLAELCGSHQQALLGDIPLLDGRFPLLVKFIDAQKWLSVQVHPNVQVCMRIGCGARPKTEAWFIIDCEPSAELYVGLKPGVSREGFVEASERGSVEEVLHRRSVKPGDMVFLPAGTVHAIGPGILLAEVQQASDTTYRVHDWNRMGLDGKPRHLHLAEALESMDFGTADAPRIEQPRSGRPGVVCDFFEMEVVLLKKGQRQCLEGKGPLVLMGVGGDGNAEVSADGETSSLSIGRTLLVPAQRARNVGIASFGQLSVLTARIRV